MSIRKRYIDDFQMTVPDKIRVLISGTERCGPPTGKIGPLRINHHYMHFNVHGPGHIVTAAADLRGSDQFGTAVILMQSVILGRSFRTPQPEIAFRTRT